MKNSHDVTPPQAKRVDVSRAERAVTELLEALGYDPTDSAFAKTPARVAHAFGELTGGVPEPMSVFENEDEMSGPVMVRDIAFISLCEHHLLPFQGRVHVAYLPGEVIGGFSGFAHAVEMFSRRLGLQETLTVNLADYLMGELSPRALAVTIEAQHMCMAARGVRAREATIVTREVRGEHRDDAEFREMLASFGGPAEAEASH